MREISSAKLFFHWYIMNALRTERNKLSKVFLSLVKDSERVFSLCNFFLFASRLDYLKERELTSGGGWWFDSSGW